MELKYINNYQHWVTGTGDLLFCLCLCTFENFQTFPLRLSGLRNWLASMRMWVRSLAQLSGLKIWHCCELWCRPVATALIQPLAWEPPYAEGVALKWLKKKERKKKKEEKFFTIKGLRKSFGATQSKKGAWHDLKSQSSWWVTEKSGRSTY